MGRASLGLLAPFRKPSSSLSSRSLWEAVISAGFRVGENEDVCVQESMDRWGWGKVIREEPWGGQR